jgi:acyl-CoA synthetase
MRPFLTLHTPANARTFYESGLWQAETFYDLVSRNAAARPDAAALQDGRRRLTWAEVKSSVDALGSGLAAAGLRPGDRVGVWMSNRVEAVLTFLACAREGFACNPSLHRSQSCEDVAALLRRIGARALLAEPGWGAGATAGRLEAVLQAEPRAPLLFSPDTLPTGSAATPPCPDPDKVCYLAFTSGTTGEPKCVMHSDNTLLANARELVRDWGHDPRTVILSLSPLSHHIAWVAVAQWLVAGCRLVTDDAPAGTSRLDWILETGATYVMGVPTHAIDILTEQERRGLSGLGAVQVFYMAGAPIPPSVAERFSRQGVRPQNVYGMTENSSHQYTHPDDRQDAVLQTCGRGGAAYEVRIFDPADPDKPLESGRIGEIGGRGAALMLGYFDDQAATEASFNAGGWFLSGDLGALDETGALRIEGRSKDLIIRGGHNIYPARIEALALRRADVEKAACFPLPDDRLGERACLAIIGDADPQALLDHLTAEGLPKADLPEFFLRLTAFPLTASGKVLKRRLAEMARRGEIRPAALRAVTPAS